MSTQKDDVSESNVTKSFTFFNTSLTYINTNRLRINNSKRTVKYLVTAENIMAQNRLAVFDAPMGYLSFLLYYTRFLSQLMVFLSKPQQESFLEHPEIYLRLTNDLLWGTCNLIQFFWWTSRVSNEAGRRGLQLEVAAQCFDVLVMIFYHQKEYQAFQEKLKTASPQEAQILLNEWEFKQLQFMRSFVYTMIFLGTLGLLATSSLTIPLAPLFFAVGLLNELLKHGIQQAQQESKLTILIEQGDLQAIRQQQKLCAQQKYSIPMQIVSSQLLFPLSFYLLITNAIWFSLPLVAVGYLCEELLRKSIENYPQCDENTPVEKNQPLARM